VVHGGARLGAAHERQALPQAAAPDPATCPQALAWPACACGRVRVPSDNNPYLRAQSRAGSAPRGMERLSVNPFAAIAGAIHTAVEHVAHSGDGLKHVVAQCAACPADPTLH